MDGVTVFDVELSDTTWSPSIEVLAMGMDIVYMKRSVY